LFLYAVRARFAAMTNASAACPPELPVPSLGRLRTLAPDGWLALAFSSAPPAEQAIASYGAVEIRRTASGLAAETCVKGELGEARATALQRLGRYMRRHHRDGISLRTMRPLVQTEQDPERWLVRIGLANDEPACGSRGERVTIRAVPSATLAVLRLSGTPAPRLIAQGAAIIREAIAATAWVEAGPPMLRLCSPLAILPFAGHCEIALPVARR
jgi:hypothetical protein